MARTALRRSAAYFRIKNSGSFAAVAAPNLANFLRTLVLPQESRGGR